MCGLQGSLTGISVEKRARAERLIFAPSSSICVCPLSSSSGDRQGECRSNGHVVNGCANGKEGKGFFCFCSFFLSLFFSFLMILGQFRSRSACRLKVPSSPEHSTISFFLLTIPDSNFGNRNFYSLVMYAGLGRTMRLSPRKRRCKETFLQT